MVSDQTLVPAQLQVRAATAIPRLTHEEAHALARAEYARLLAVVEALAGDDWAQPTYCTLWSARELVSHLAGGAAAFSSWREFQRHYLTNPHKREWAKPEDACNFLQVKERAGRRPDEVVREFRERAPREIQARHRLPWLVRKLPLPLSPPISVGYLTDTVLTRDWWIHRLDLCHATGRAMTLTPEHDGRLTALVVLELAGKVKGALGGSTVDLVLTGPAGGHYRFGDGVAPDTTLEISVLDFHLRTSERLDVAEALARAVVRGQAGVAPRFLERATVMY